MNIQSPPFKSYLQLHLAVFLYGFTAILGELIQMPGIGTVVYRMGFTFVSLCFFPAIFQKLKSIPPKARLRIAGIGIIMAFHWVTFFEAIKQANVSIALCGFATYAFFTALLEPIYFKRRIKWLELVLAGITLLGLGIIFQVADERFHFGLILALISALLISFSGVINKDVVADYDIYAISWIEFAAGFGCLALLFPFYKWVFPDTPVLPSDMDWLWLLILALLCTTFAWSLNMLALRHVSAYTVSLSLNLEPVYGIILAIIFFQENEYFGGSFYLGATLIIGAVFLHPILARRVGED